MFLALQRREQLAVQGLKVKMLVFEIFIYKRVSEVNIDEKDLKSHEFDDFDLIAKTADLEVLGSELLFELVSEADDRVFLGEEDLLQKVRDG